MNKKNILLTIWLLLPITIVSLLMVWIFYSLDKDRLMADAVPIGAGAGDTGNANALGEWLAGRNPDAVSRALDARREGRAIDPREWPGGVDLRVSFKIISKMEIDWYLDIKRDGKVESVLVSPESLDEDSRYSIVLTQKQVSGATIWIGEGASDAGARHYFWPQIPDTNLQTSQPMVVYYNREIPVERKSP